MIKSVPCILRGLLVAVAGFLSGGLFGFLVCIYAMPRTGGEAIILGAGLAGALMAVVTFFGRSSAQPPKTPTLADPPDDTTDEPPTVVKKTSHNHGLLALAAFISGPVLGGVIGFLAGIGEHPMDRWLYVAPIMFIGLIVGGVVAVAVLGIGAYDQGSD